jgi:2,3-bisphosphoglycerate-dependent phosphoglycerate mutase
VSIDIVAGEAGGEIGSASFFTAFFSTILVRLENGRWGSRFPVIMKELYSGAVPSQRAAAARQELRAIRTELQRFTPDQIVWNHEDLSARPPWGDNIASRITDLSNYFVASRGQDLIDLLSTTFAYSEANDIPVEIR